MNKKLIISIGIAVALSSAASYADTTIYTDGIGRIHFLGRDAANNTSNARYTNSASQDLTRKLYEQSENATTEDTTYDQHPLKNYENTFPDSRFNSYKRWIPKSEADTIQEEARKSTVTATKGATDYTGQYQYGSTILPEAQNDENVVKTKAKKHWWNK